MMPRAVGGGHRVSRRDAGLGRRALVLAVSTALVVAQASPSLAYLKLGSVVNGKMVDLTWTRTPARYFVNDGGVPGVSSGDLQAAVARAFSTWQAVSTSAITYEFAGFTSALPLEDDGQSTIGFMDRPDLDRVLASTSFLIDQTTGALLESDIFFNTIFPWSVAEGGEAGRYDILSIALHETGHFGGLGHSALGETEMRAGGGRRVIASQAVMFPIAFSAGSIAGRTLRPDDIAGISDLYPDGGFSSNTGSVSGKVLLAGHGVFGAHVVAFGLADGELIGGFSLDDQGSFTLAGLSPGPHLIRVEPLDDADPDSFFDSTEHVELDFRVVFLKNLVAVPRGGGRSGVEVTAAPK